MTRPTPPARRPSLRLVAAYGRAVLDGPVGRPFGAPEQPMAVRFEGLTEDEQRAALAAFPGGRRFVLVAPVPN